MNRPLSSFSDGFSHPAGVMGNALRCAINGGMSTIDPMSA